LASLAASNVPDAPVPAPWPLPPVTVPEAFDPPDAPVEDEPALLPLVAPAVPEPLALVEDLPPQLTTKASTTSSAAPLVSDMAKASESLGIPSPDKVIPIIDTAGLFEYGGTVGASARYAGGGMQWFATETIPAGNILPAQTLAVPP
jgi:hypothetical protein